jgi:hypothetical protein
MLDISKLEFETLLTSKELANGILSDPSGYFVAIKTTCCKKTIPYKVPKKLVKKAQQGALNAEESKFHHCTSPYTGKSKTESKTETIEFFCKRCKFISEDPGCTSCTVCFLMDSMREVKPIVDSAEAGPTDINLTDSHVKRLLLYAGGYRIIKDVVLLEDEDVSSTYSRYGSKSTKPATLYPGVYDPESVTSSSDKKTKEHIKINRGLNPEFKPL